MKEKRKINQKQAKYCQLKCFQLYYNRPIYTPNQKARKKVIQN